MLPLKLPQPAPEVFPHQGGIFHQVLLLQDVHDGVAHGRGQEIPPEGGSVVARLQHRAVGLGQHRADGEASPQTFGQGHHVRLDPIVLVSEEFAGPTQARLHLVHDEQEALLIAQPPQALQILLGGRIDAGFSLDRFHQDGAGLVVDGLLGRFQVVVGHVDETRHQRLEALLVFGLAGGRDGGQGAAMERIPGGNDLRGFPSQPHVAVLAGQLHGGLIGLSPTVAEEHPIEDGALHQLAGQLRLRLNVVQVGGVPQLASLLRQGRHQSGMAMPQATDGNA